jgi:predicted nucleic acid-binding protein
VKLYVDSSVALRIVLGQPNPLRQWSDFAEYIASALLRVECFRAIDRLRFAHRRAEEQAIQRLGTLHDFLRRLDLVPVASAVLDRAAESFPLPLKTLDAIHLSTALVLRQSEDPHLVFATHDEALGMSARALDFSVLGL